MMAAILAFFKALPQLLKLVERVEEADHARKVEEKIEEDSKSIEKAFKDNDAKALRDTFNK